MPSGVLPEARLHCVPLYHHRVDLTAFILAGGKSTRMGRDKAFLPWEGGTLLSHALSLATSVAGAVWIVGSKGKFANFGSVVEDVYPDRGPLGGIHAALTSTAADLNLMLAVDLPFINPRILDYIVAQARKSGAVVTVARSGGRWQPLCAVYRRAFAKVAELSLKEGKNRIDPLFAQVDTRVIEEDELAWAGFSPDMFRNLNTPDDLERATQNQGSNLQ